MLMPKKTKFRKQQRGTMAGLSKGARSVTFGQWGLEAVEPCWLTAQQIEALRVTVARKLPKEGKFFLRVFPDKPIAKKPAETRMGKGKGSTEFWVSVVKRGRILCEVGNMTEQEAKNALRVAKYKLPVKTRFITKQVEGNNNG